MKEHLEKSTTKYEDPSQYEAISDNYLFFPLSDVLVTPLRNVGLTPNKVTILSSLFTLSTIYFLHIKKIEYACAVYFIGYLLDCVDGNMARKYNMGSKYGMALDMVSDQLTSIALIGYAIYMKGYDKWYIPANIVVVYLCFTAMGITDAIASHKKTGTDNFYQNKVNEVANEDAFIFKLFLLAQKSMYNNYKMYFPTYDENKLKKYLTVLKEFGPGNVCIYILCILYYYNNEPLNH